MIGGPIINLDILRGPPAEHSYSNKVTFYLKMSITYFFFRRVVGEGGLPPSPSLWAGPEFARPKKRSNPVSVIGVCIQWYLNTHGKGLSWTKEKMNQQKMNHNLYNCCFLNNYLFSFLLNHRKLTRFELRKECLKRRKRNFRESWQILRLLLQIINAKDCRCTTTSPNF